jgi:hypothetical protein
LDELVPRRPWADDDPKETTVHLDPLLSRRLEGRRWELRAAQWRAWELAEAVFGSRVRLGLKKGNGPGTFRGLITLFVPFRSLEDHRGREELFLSWAGADPVLARVPFIYVFEPVPEAVPAPGP